MPSFVIGVQATSQVDTLVGSSSIYPLLVTHESTVNRKASSMIGMFSAAGADFILVTDSTTMTGEGIVLRPANDLNPYYRAFGVVNAAGTENHWFASKGGDIYMKGFVTHPVNSVASAASVVVPGALFHITGTNAIATLVAPQAMVSNGGCVNIIPDEAFTTVTSGNIALASTAVVNRVMTQCYDPATSKWYPSY
jgi:hypothetical protein